MTTNDKLPPAPLAREPGPALIGAKAEAAGANAAEVDPHKAVGFQLLVTHYYESRSANPDDPAWALYREMLSSWQSREGNITSAYYCENIVAAAVTTDRDCVFSAGDPYRRKVDLPLYSLMTRADHLGQFVEDSLVGPQRRTSIEEVFAIETNLLACMDALAAQPAPPAEVADELRAVTCSKVEADLAHAEQYAYAVWQRRAQIAYLKGMGLGIIGVAVVVLAAAVLYSPFIDRFPVTPKISYVPWALLLGALGAVLSVLQRLTHGNLRLRLDSSLTENRTLGAFRPIIGSALGVALVILVLGGLIPLELPSASNALNANALDAEEKRAFFLAGLAFLAGFSERFAQDMIGIGKSTRPATPDVTKVQAEVPDEGSPAAQ